MPRVSWRLEARYPVVHVRILGSRPRESSTLSLLADTGAGHAEAPFELVLSEVLVRRFALLTRERIRLGGAIRGWHPVSVVRIDIPGLVTARRVRAVAVPVENVPSGVDGIAGFRFLNRFSYGNFGDPNGFGLELPEAV